MTETGEPRVLEHADVDRSWPEGLDVLILPGVGGGPVYGDAFAPKAWEVEEALRATGISVAYVGGDPDHVILLKSADWWGPILRITEELGTGVGGAALYAAIANLVTRRHSRDEVPAAGGLTVHIEIQVVSAANPSEGVTTVIADEEDVALAKLHEVLGLGEN